MLLTSRKSSGRLRLRSTSVLWSRRVPRRLFLVLLPRLIGNPPGSTFRLWVVTRESGGGWF